MKRSDSVKYILIVIGALALIALLQRIPHEGYQGPLTGNDLLKTIKRDRQATVGNEGVDKLIKNDEYEPVVPPTGIIALSDRTFSLGYDEIYDHREKYSGREISVSGYVDKDNLPQGQFLVGRDLVWCCQNDMYFIGFLVLTDGKIPDANAELRVTGFLEPVSYADPKTKETFLVPAIRAKKIESAPKFSHQVSPG